MQVAKALHSYGTPAYRLEQAVDQLARALGLRAQVLATPTALQLAFETPLGQSPHLERVAPSEPDLGKLVAVEQVVTSVERGTTSPQEGSAAITALQGQRQRYGAWWQAMAGAVASGTAVVFFGGGAYAVAAATLLGLSLRGLASLTANRPEAPGVYELVAAFTASLAGWLLSAAVPSVAPEVVTLATLIMLVPGLTLTIAVSELASGHLVSGTARLAGAATLFVTLAFGTALGQATAQWLVGTGGLQPAPPLPLVASLAALAVAPVAFAVLFQAAPRDIPWIWVAGVVAFVGARIGAFLLGPELGVFLGAIALGGAGNLYRRWAHRPPLVLRAPGLLLLVPGSIGFRSLSSFMAEDPVAGTHGLFRVALIAVGLVAGLFTANLLVSPTAGQRTRPDDHPTG